MPANRGDAAARLEKERLAVESRLAGMGYEDIAALVGYANKSGAYKAVQRALKRRQAEPVDELRNMELQRLDILLAGVWTSARKGNTAAIDRALAIMRQRARYVPGLEEPEDGGMGVGGGTLNVVLSMPEPEQVPATAQEDLGDPSTWQRSGPRDVDEIPDFDVGAPS